MSNSTVAYINEFANYLEILEYIRKKYDSTAKVIHLDDKTAFTESAIVCCTIGFNYSGENRELFYAWSYDINDEEYNKRGKVYLSLGKWGSSTEILTSILVDFHGGWIKEDDCSNEDFKSVGFDYYYVLCLPEGHKYDDGATSTVYITLCKKPHWESDGIMLQSGLYDATKFEEGYKYMNTIFKELEKKYLEMGKGYLKLVKIDKSILGSTPREVWSEVKGDFDETLCCGGTNFKGGITV